MFGTGRAMVDLSVLRDYVRFTAVCAVAMAVLLTGLALVRDTTGYDWYAAARLTLTQAMLAVGFDPYASTEYRMGSGLTLPMMRGVLSELDGPREARARILSAIADHAGLGAVAGIGCAATLLIWLGSGGRWARLAAMREPVRAPPVKPATTKSCLALCLRFWKESLSCKGPSAETTGLLTRISDQCSLALIKPNAR